MFCRACGVVAEVEVEVEAKGGDVVAVVVDDFACFFSFSLLDVFTTPTLTALVAFEGPMSVFSGAFEGVLSLMSFFALILGGFEDVFFTWISVGPDTAATAPESYSVTKS